MAGGVPSAADVQAAVDDMEELYAGCGWCGLLDGSDDLSDPAAWSGSLSGAGASFMKKEVLPQPYTPPPALVQGGSVFPTSGA